MSRRRTGGGALALWLSLSLIACGDSEKFRPDLNQGDLGAAVADAGSGGDTGSTLLPDPDAGAQEDAGHDQGNAGDGGSGGDTLACTCGDGRCEAACGENLASCLEDCRECGDGVCSEGELPSEAAPCPADCMVCGDGVCTPGESPHTCEEDCCGGGCGDGLCLGYGCGENPETCPVDCGTACGDGSCARGESPDTCPDDCLRQVCGNQICEPTDGGVSKCPADCAPTCGDCDCEGGEDWQTCPVDCGFCGDGVCSTCAGAAETEESCAADCLQCEPSSCTDLGAACGLLPDDGCGRPVFCGSCEPPDSCGGGGAPNQCGCTPTTCDAAGAECGVLDDGCGDSLSCGTCVTPLTCGGGGAPNRCGCTQERDEALCARHGAECGELVAFDNCGEERAVHCGGCTQPDTCGGGGEDNRCGCEPESDRRFCARHEARCGELSDFDNCGAQRTVLCGTCLEPETCGGAGVPHECGCTRETDQSFCSRREAECGEVSDFDNCGAQRAISCGACVEPETCGGGGTPNQCGCTPLTCATAGAECGVVDDTCGGEIPCGSCAPLETCGGGGASNRCGCTPESDQAFCARHEASCGALLAFDDCGEEREVRCGACAPPGTCGGGGVPWVCGCTPRTCEDAGATCGEIGDLCGSTLQCGACEPPFECGGAGQDNVCGCDPIVCGRLCDPAADPDPCGGVERCVDPEGDGVGSCAEVVGEDAPCDPAGLQTSCLGGRGTCRAAPGAPAGVCVRHCAVEELYPCGFAAVGHKRCHDPEGDGEGLCLVTRQRGEDCDASGQTDACAEGSTCAQLPGETTANCLEACSPSTPCDPGKGRCPCDDWAGDCVDPGAGGAGYCLPFPGWGEPCDEERKRSGCRDGACLQIEGEEGPTCAPRCDLAAFLFCPDAKGCADGDGDGVGLCLPAVPLGEPCDATGTLNACRPSSFGIPSLCVAEPGAASGICRQACAGPGFEHWPFWDDQTCADSDHEVECVTPPGSRWAVCAPPELGMAQGDACDPTDAAQWCAAAGILVVGACLPSLSGEGDTCQAACEPGSDGACGWLDTRTSFVCLDTGGGEGTCVETIALGEPCSPEPGSLPCHSPRATLPGICEDPAGDGAFSCVVACDHEGGREDLQCPYGTACGVPEGEGEGRCLPAVPDNAECSPDAQGSACEWYRDEEDQLWYPGTCRPGFAGAKAYCSRPCGDGKRCNNVEGFVMRNMSCGSAGWCVPEATSGQTCDPAGAKVVCVDAKEQPTPLCVASAGASGGHCRPPCVVTGRYCSTDTGDPGGEMEGTQGLCFDSDGALHGYCLPQRRDGQACDPEGLSDVCSGLCEPEDGGSGICAELGSCSLPADLVSLGTLPGGGELAVSGLLSGERNALQPASCSSSQGPEQVWRLDVAERSRVRIEVHALSGSNEDDLQVYVRSDCADPSSEIACTDTSGSTEELDLGIVEAGSAFDVIVDSYRSSWSLGYWLVVRMLGVRAAGEACDPAGVADTCDDGLACHSTSDACVAAGCGDGVLEDGEECDDAGVAPGDGCSASCTYETVTEVEPNDGDGEDTAAGAALRLLGDMASHVDIDRFELVFPEGARYRMRATLQPREGDCASTGLRHVNFKLVDASGALLAKQERSCGDDEPFEVGAPDGLPAGIYSLQLGETGYAVQEHAPYAVDLHIEAGPIAADSEPCGPLFSDGVCGDTSFCRAHDPEAEGSCAPILCGDGIVVTPEEECEDGNAQPGDGCLDCHLEIFHEIEPNNALDVANELGPYRRVTGTIPVERDKDVFELELTEHAAVFVVGSDGKGGCPPVTLRLALLRAGDQTELAYSSWWGCDEDEPTELSPQSDRDLRSVEPGSYFLSVEASDSSETSAAQYFLDIDVAPLPAEGQPCAVYQDGKIFCAPALVCVPKTSLCETPECGDGVLSEDAGEECDDGGTEPGDGCDTSCLKDFLLETEPNDVPAEAQEGLAPPFLLRGSLSSELDADLYEVRVEHPFRAVAALHDIEGECSEDSRRLDLDLLDETGHRVLASAGCWDFLGSSAGSLGSLVAPGGYLLRVRWDSSFGDVLDQPLEYELRWAPELWSAPIPRPE